MTRGETRFVSSPVSNAPAGPVVALVTSGFGARFGGIGVVAELVRSALAPRTRLVVWRHHASWPRALRVTALLSRVLLATRRTRPRSVFYDHGGLARLHSLVPALRGVPYGVVLHGMEAWQPLAGRMRAAFERATRIVAVSNTALVRASRANPWLLEVAVTWLGVKRSQAELAASRRPWALIVGRMDARERMKGHDEVLDAWPAMRAAVPEARLLIVGEGSDRARLERRVRREGLAGVAFLGFLPDAERDALYQTAALFLFPSRQEGFGLAAIEAAAAGMCVVGLAGTVLEELLGDTAILIEQPTATLIAEATLPLLRSPERALVLGAAARQRVETALLEQHFASRFLTAIGDLVSG